MGPAEVRFALKSFLNRDSETRFGVRCVNPHFVLALHLPYDMAWLADVFESECVHKDYEKGATELYVEGAGQGR